MDPGFRDEGHEEFCAATAQHLHRRTRGSPSQEALNLLASWITTPADIAADATTGGDT